METSVTIATTASHATDDDSIVGTITATSMAANRESSDPTNLSSLSTINEWFRNASPKECATMTAILLDYRFEADAFRIEWWTQYAEPLGFTRVDYYHYRLPSSFGRFCCGTITSSDNAGAVTGSSTSSIHTNDNAMIHTAETLCRELNTLAIPQGRSVYDRIGDGTNNSNNNRKKNTSTTTCMLERAIGMNRIQNVAIGKDDIVDQWTMIRETLIFRKFHTTITKECHNKSAEHQKQKSDKNTDKTKKARLLPEREQQSSSSSSRNGKGKVNKLSAAAKGQKQRLWMSDDAGAELFFHKGKRRKGNLPGKALATGGNNNKIAAIQNLETAPPPINYPTTMKAYKECARTHQLNEIASNREKSLIESSFEEWKFLLSTNHSLLLYGVGSKMNLLNRFSNHDIEGDVVELDGFDNNLTMDGILQLLIDQWLGGQELSIRKKHLFHVHFEKNDRTNRCNTAERIAPFFPRQGEFHIVQKAFAVAKRIARQVMKTSRPITLVIHNIDGVGLCNDIAQEVLAVLISQSRTDCGLNAIRLVASIDHINGQIFTESQSRHRLHWLRKEVHTHRPYVAEVLHEQASLEDSHASEQSKFVAEERDYHLENDMTEEDHLLLEHESIFSVLKSLASTHAESLRQLARLQLESNQDWVNYTDLLKQCRAARIVQADQQLRLYLGELLDHNILERDKNKAASSMTSYRIPYSDEILNLIWNFKTDR
jgi:origin recognition complex subunit 2